MEQHDSAPASTDILPQGVGSVVYRGLKKMAPGDEGTPCHDPRLNADGTFLLEENDGEVLGPYPVWIGRKYRTLVSDTLASKETDELRIGRAELWVTEARVLVKQVAPSAKGQFTVGHFRYSWLESIDFNGKQGLLTAAALRLVLGGGPNQGNVVISWLNMKFEFEKKYDPAPLAQIIVQRAARHNLRQPDFPSKYADQMALLGGAPLLPLPAKKESSEYEFPTHREWPGSATWWGEDESESS